MSSRRGHFLTAVLNKAPVQHGMELSKVYGLLYNILLNVDKIPFQWITYQALPVGEWRVYQREGGASPDDGYVWSDLIETRRLAIAPNDYMEMRRFRGGYARSATKYAVGKTEYRILGSNLVLVHYTQTELNGQAIQGLPLATERPEASKKTKKDLPPAATEKTIQERLLATEEQDIDMGTATERHAPPVDDLDMFVECEGHAQRWAQLNAFLRRFLGTDHGGQKLPVDAANSASLANEIQEQIRFMEALPEATIDDFEASSKAFWSSQSNPSLTP